MKVKHVGLVCCIVLSLVPGVRAGQQSQSCEVTPDQAASLVGKTVTWNGVFVGTQVTSLGGKVDTLHIYRCTGTEAAPVVKDVLFAFSVADSVSDAAASKAELKTVLRVTGTFVKFDDVRAENALRSARILKGVKISVAPTRQP